MSFHVGQQVDRVGQNVVDYVGDDRHGSSYRVLEYQGSYRLAYFHLALGDLPELETHQGSERKDQQHA